MREAIGSSLLFNIVIIFVSLVILFFVGTLAYSKAYKVKNRIISIIEKYESYEDSKDNIDDTLHEVGYNIAEINCENTKYYKNRTPEERKKLTPLNTFGYMYCIYEYNLSANERYYAVVTFTHFDIPIIGGFLQFPVSGETRILGKKYDY